MTPEIICSNFALALTVKSIFVIVIVIVITLQYILYAWSMVPLFCYIAL